MRITRINRRVPENWNFISSRTSQADEETKAFSTVSEKSHNGWGVFLELEAFDWR